MTTTLTRADIRDLLELIRDSIIADGLSFRSNNQSHYNDEMWRNWRVGHVAYVNTIESTIELVSDATLARLSQVAVTYEPGVIEELILFLMGEVVCVGGVDDELATAEQFFNSLINLALAKNRSLARKPDAKSAILGWISFIDPLKISKDSEGGYELRHQLH